jgi:hypothetical protein
MFDKPRRDGLHTAPPQPYQRSSAVSPRAAASDAPGDSEAIRQYRRFFETHDLSGTPRRADRAAR